MQGSKTNYHHGNLRSALIDAAFTILDAEGVDAVSIRKVARIAGVAHSAPVNHFKDKRTLLTALATDVFKDLADAVLSTLDAADGVLARKIHLFSEAVMEFALMYPHRYRLLWRGDSLLNEDESLNQAMDSIYDPLIEMLSDSGANVDESTESQAIALWSLLHGYVIMRLDNILVAKTDESSGEDRLSAMINLYLRGIGLSS